MANNRKFVNGRQLVLAVASGTTSGSPVLVGSTMTGVALNDRDSSGNATVDFGGVYTLSCKAVDDSGNSAIALGDEIFYTDADTPKLSKKSSGFFFGYALGAVTAGSTASIDVKQVDGPAGGGSDMAALIDHFRVINVRNTTGSTITAGSLVYISGWDETNKRFTITKAINTGLVSIAQFIVTADIANNANGTATKQARRTGLATNGSTVGNPVYLDSSAGGWTLTKPTTAGQVPQIIGRVAVVDTTVGEIEFDLDFSRSFGAIPFKSTEQTGTGGAQNIAHGLGVVPSMVVVFPTDTSPATAGVYVVTEGTHDATNVVVTVTTGKKYKVVAWA